MKPKINLDKKLAAGIACGIAAAILMSIYLSDARAEALSYREDAIRQYGGETVQVCVATHDISQGKTISQQDVELKTWVADLLPENATTNVADVVGQTAQQTIMSNEPISKSKVGAQHLDITVPDGLCAVSAPEHPDPVLLRTGDAVHPHSGAAGKVRRRGRGSGGDSLSGGLRPGEHHYPHRGGGDGRSGAGPCGL